MIYSIDYTSLMPQPDSDGSMNEKRKELASFYVAGCLPATEELEFEEVLADDVELRAHTADLMDMAVAALLPSLGRIQEPDAEVRASIFGQIFPAARAWKHFRALGVQNNDALVVTDVAGCVEWVSPAFTRMCGYAVEELKGHKPGHFLQGPETDPEALHRLRQAIGEKRAVSEDLVNYHKDGHSYRVRVEITPILDETANLAGFAAVEHEMRLD